MHFLLCRGRSRRTSNFNRATEPHSESCQARDCVPHSVPYGNFENPAVRQISGTNGLIEACAVLARITKVAELRLELRSNSRSQAEQKLQPIPWHSGGLIQYSRDQSITIARTGGGAGSRERERVGCQEQGRFRRLLSLPQHPSNLSLFSPGQSGGLEGISVGDCVIGHVRASEDTGRERVSKHNV